MKIKLFLRKLLLFCIPLLLFIGLYCYVDPFKVVRHYDVYYQSGKPCVITLNRDYVSTEHWLNHYAEYRYDSYIFGNSRSLFYEVAEWKKYIKPGGECYHFDASRESLYGIERKFDFLAARKVRISNALIVLDQNTLEKTDNSKGHLYIKDPHLSGQNAFFFQVSVWRDVIDFHFLKALVDFKLSGKVKEYMKKDYLLDDRPLFYDPVSNEIRLDDYEALIKRNPEEYYASRKGQFHLRDTGGGGLREPLTGRRVIGEEQLRLLGRIREVLTQDSSDYRIVISPLYNQERLNPDDFQALKAVFGEGKVFDFSGVNAFTRDPHNYYEGSHYRPQVAREIMRTIYAR